MPVYVRSRLARGKIHHHRLARIAERLLAMSRESGSELSVELIGDRRMRRLNRVYRRQDRSTDVLSFPMREARGPRTKLLGDVVISMPTARRQARQAGRSVSEELAMLLIHGVLHLCGYDHERGEQEARRMRRRERAMLRGLSPLPDLTVRRRHG
jgi:rRNA maturation RNase YbeY